MGLKLTPDRQSINNKYDVLNSDLPPPTPLCLDPALMIQNQTLFTKSRIPHIRLEAVEQTKQNTTIYNKHNNM